MSSSTKRIFICCSSFPPEVGGAPGRIYNLAKLLVASGYEITVFTSMPNYPKGRIFPEYRGKVFFREVLDGIDVRRLWLLPSNSSKLWPRGLSILSQCIGIFLGAAPRILFGRADAVYVSSPPLISAWLYTLLASLSGKKIIINISDIWPLTANELGVMKEGFMMRLLHKAERFLYRSAAAILGQSNEILDHVRRVTPGSVPLFLYRNLPEAAEIARTSHTSVTGNSPRRIVYAGALGFAQGLFEICRDVVFSDSGVSLDIYGDGVERGLIQKLLESNPELPITLNPALPAAQMQALLPEYDAMLIPLRNPIRGAVPSKLYAAISAGLPVLFCGGGEGEQIVAQYDLGWVMKPGDYTALSKCILELKALSNADVALMRESILGISKKIFDKRQQDDDFILLLSEVITRDSDTSRSEI